MLIFKSRNLPLNQVIQHPIHRTIVVARHRIKLAQCFLCNTQRKMLFTLFHTFTFNEPVMSPFYANFVNPCPS